MTPDRIVEEVRAARAALLKAAGGTLHGLFDFLARQEAEAGRTPVSLPPKRPEDGGHVDKALQLAARLEDEETVRKLARGK